MCPWGCSATGMVPLGSTPPISPRCHRRPRIQPLQMGFALPGVLGRAKPHEAAPGPVGAAMPFAGAGAGPPTRCTLRSLLGLRQHKRQIISASPPPGRWKMCKLFPAGARLPPHCRARGAGDRNGARGTGSTRGSPSTGEDGMRGLPPPRGSIPTPRPGSKVQTPEQHGHPGWFCLLGKRQPPTERRAAKQGRELKSHGQGARGQGSVR